MSGHTPGEWVRSGGIIQTVSGIMIADARVMSNETATSWGCVRGVGDLVEMEANACLIAAAPEMLEALRGMLLPESHCPACKGRGGEGPYGANPICGECGGSGWDERPRRDAYAAVRKAEGR